VVDEIGKNISGGGADANVTGRSARNAPGFDKPRVAKMVFLDLTDASKGNAAGIAAADLITEHLFKRIDFGVTYSNLVASTYLEAVRSRFPWPMATLPCAWP
jgi:hypothetical protein